MPNSSIQYKYHPIKKSLQKNISRNNIPSPWPLQPLVPSKQCTHSILKEHVYWLNVELIKLKILQFNAQND